MNLDEQRAFLKLCYEAPLVSHLRLRKPITPPPKPLDREVFPEGTCEDCGAEEDYLGRPVPVDEDTGKTLCPECRSMRRPGGY